MQNSTTPSRTPSGVSLMKTYMPPSSTNINASDVEVIFNKNSSTKFTCISSNLDSAHCKTTAAATAGTAPNIATNAAASKCIAMCPNSTANDKAVIYKSDDTNKWAWSSSFNNITGVGPTKQMIKEPISYKSPSNVTSSCYIINAQSPNCPTVNSFGCQAYCMASPSASSFIVEQRCPDNEKSCDPMKLKWMKK